MQAHFRRMFEWMGWADERVICAVGECAAAQGEALPLVAHLVAAEHVWLSRLEGREPRLAVWPTLSLEECASLATENVAGYLAFVDRLSDAAFHDLIEYRNQSGQSFSTAVIDILTQILTHGPYHRGQIAKILGRYGVAAPGTDYIFYVRERG